MTIPIIDLFAGLGGLNEGFSAFEDASGIRRFETAVSFEMEAAACDRLAMRATYRRLRDTGSGFET